jgi:hypothetical protein
MLSQLTSIVRNSDICQNILVCIISLFGAHVVFIIGTCGLHPVHVCCSTPVSVVLAVSRTNAMLCVAERTLTPEVNKATTVPPSSHKPLLVDQRPNAFQSTQRPLPPTPGDNKLPEKPSGEL